ncbi:RNA methyltransferase [Polymorphobacter fuscus]|uniref:RNA methyltransferase n=1 Tax=Sandarakinorhabdus fusca TaxID=1439888 RepID=A0A7C9GPP0_9SPHN|nr:RNA methyltransferase [Polymorphobacter fuscus]KAB7648319.1 RNA methyltransferase [Polymorphobacter fuscus]MQT15831.1 RNA methyltransferase [Polymorphobacter fuscus]NJC07895.1 tRNA/rRNA methyltransferase [Polymorphobacter fuscus]
MSDTLGVVAPAVILVRPQLGVNIGACARAMLNFGLTDLRLVAPRDGWPNPDAGPAASGADVVLANARVFDTVAEACAGLGLIFATTMRGRELTRRVVTPAQAAREFHGLAGQGGLMYGPERTGLETEDLAVAHAILTIPVNPDFGSLNLAQAVIVSAYEWFRQADDTEAATLVNHDGPAPHEELEGLIDAVDVQLRANGYYNPVPGRAAAARLLMRNLFTRPEFTAGEVRSLRGIVRGLSQRRGGG